MSPGKSSITVSFIIIIYNILNTSVYPNMFGFSTTWLTESVNRRWAQIQISTPTTILFFNLFILALLPISRFTNSDLLNRDLVILEATEVQWEHCHTQVGCIVWTICSWFWGARSLDRRYEAAGSMFSCCLVQILTTWLSQLKSRLIRPARFFQSSITKFWCVLGIRASLPVLSWPEGRWCGLPLLYPIFFKGPYVCSEMILMLWLNFS